LAFWARGAEHEEVKAGLGGSGKGGERDAMAIIVLWQWLPVVEPRGL
jgi:hypothetical protein